MPTRPACFALVRSALWDLLTIIGALAWALTLIIRCPMPGNAEFTLLIISGATIGSLVLSRVLGGMGYRKVRWSLRYGLPLASLITLPIISFGGCPINVLEIGFILLASLGGLLWLHNVLSRTPLWDLPAIMSTAGWVIGLASGGLIPIEVAGFGLFGLLALLIFGRLSGNPTRKAARLAFRIGLPVSSIAAVAVRASGGMFGDMVALLAALSALLIAILGLSLMILGPWKRGF